MMSTRETLARVLGIVSLTVFAAGCTTSPDPHEGGLINSWAGVVGGGYQVRIDKLDAEHDRRLDEQEDLRREAARIRAERTQVSAELDASRRRLDALQRRIERARRAQQGQMSADAHSKLNEAEELAASVRNDLARTSPDAYSVDELKSASAAIDRRMTTADYLVNEAWGL